MNGGSAQKAIQERRPYSYVPMGGGENYIETIWGRGYVLRDPVGELDRGEENHKQVVNF